jgi:hypothetical protein
VKTSLIASWVKRGLDLDAATAWLAVGCTNAGRAALARDKGVDPLGYEDWVARRKQAHAAEVAARSDAVQGHRGPGEMAWLVDSDS